MMDGRRIAGAIGGALVAGAGITALMMVQERRSGDPSELVELERRSLARAGLEAPAGGGLPDAGEQAIVQGGHLLLSAAAGLAYALATDEDAGVVPSGVLFGIAFYGVAHWIAGPLLGVKEPEWRADSSTIAMHTANHLLFGLAAAAGARLAERQGG